MSLRPAPWMTCPPPAPTALLGLMVASAALFPGCGPEVTPIPGGVSAPAEVPVGAALTPGADWSTVVYTRIAATGYAPVATQGGYRVANRDQRLTGTFSAGGLAVSGPDGGEIRLALRAWGREDALEGAEAPSPVAGACVPGAGVDAFGECVRRVEYARPGLVEWWSNRPEGLEQGFTVEAAPDGDGPLVFDVEVHGASAEVEASGATFTPDDPSSGELSSGGATGALRYEGLAAWDARGHVLPAWMEPTTDGLRLVVDDTGAVGTITVDPLLTTVGWTEGSDQASAGFGGAIAPAGDINGDGFGDVLVGAASYDNPESNEGRVYLYLGSASGPGTTAAWTAEANSASAGFGGAVAAAGDVNGDGYGDVVVGARGYTRGQAGEGAAFVYLGSSAGLASTAAWTVEGNLIAAAFGGAVASAGDVNADGYADVLIGAPGYTNGSTGEGAVYVYLGASTGLATTAAWTAEANVISAALGTAVGSAGDVNGDGYGDIIVGADGYANGNTGEGAAFVYLGSASGVGASAAWTAEGNQTGAGLGTAVGAAGDVNGDGYADIVVGADGYDNGQTDEGRVSVYLGSATGPAASATWTAESNQASAAMGASVATAGDVNGDGYADLVVGAAAYDDGQTDEGRAYLYLGSASGLRTSTSWTASSDQTGAGLGANVAAAGDVNGDGFGDVLARASSYDDGVIDEGHVFLYYGAGSGLTTSPVWSAEADEMDAQYGYAVASAGDVNGDGYGDMVVGAYTMDNGETDEGRAFLYLGSASGLETTAAWSVQSNEAFAYLGYAVASAGDVNGDGYGDVTVGAYREDSGYTNEGAAFVYYGSATGLSPTANWTGSADQDYGYFGVSVASAGDVNGDGYGDLVVGAFGYEEGELDEGRVYVYYGGPGGLSTAPAWIVDSNQISSRFGRCVASAGDVNGDGFSDVLVGAPHDDTAAPDAGAVYLYLGASVGLSTTPDWSATSDQSLAYFGQSAASAGDINGDGYADVIIGAYAYDDGETDEGKVYVYLGSAAGLDTTPSWTHTSDQESAAAGYSVASAGDVNGDGYADIVLGAPFTTNGATDEGRAEVYLGSATGLGAAAAWSGEVDQAGAYFGTAVASAGDVNGDGYGDLVVGAVGWDDGESDEGAARVFLGNGADGTGSGVALRPQARQSGLTTPIFPGLATTSEDTFDVAVMSARTARGRGKVKLQVEVKPLGTPFDGTGLVSASGYTDSTGLGVTLQQAVEDLDLATGYQWRARVASSPAEGHAQAWGPWLHGGLPGAAHSGHVFTPGITAYADDDGDGYGNVDAPRTARDPYSGGFSFDATDCDDTNADVSPGAVEVCDDLDTDEDCSGTADDADAGATSKYTWYVDADSDSYGGTSTVEQCDQPSGYVATSGDCDDASAGINPGRTELCDAFDVDENCDGTAGTDDRDGDGYAACDDCDDSNPDRNAGLPEVCDSGDVDEDCDGLADDQDSSTVDKISVYQDNDHDGYGSTTVLSYCDLPISGVATNDEDCNDSVATANPAGSEICDATNVDEDCDGLIDDADDSVNSAGKSSWYFDEDGDGYGDLGYPGTFCDAPEGTVSSSTDCDDAAAGVHPGAREVCDAADVDEDCDGLVDDDDATLSDSSKSNWYLDVDGDGYGAVVLGAYCDGPSGSTASAGDCDDASAGINPGAAEVCDAADADEDCDGFVEDLDPSATGKTTVYVDVDGDGYGSTTAAAFCAVPGTGYAATATDCNDVLASVYPGAAERTGDNVDGDCDGAEVCFVDADDDGYVADAVATVASVDTDCDDPGEARASDLGGDCNDGSVLFHPGVAETDCADATDYNCDGSSATEDRDGDGWVACQDCADNDVLVNPSAAEDPGDAIDADCDGADSCFVDLDGDGYRPNLKATVVGITVACNAAGEATADDPIGDCDDNSATVNPDIAEIIGNGVDNDCDGGETCYRDADNDGYRSLVDSFVLSADGDCTDPGEALAGDLGGDCDDGDAAYHPGAAESSCRDPHDYNCDGSIGFEDIDGDGYSACEDCDDTNASVNVATVEVAGDALDGDCDGTEICYVDQDGDGYRVDDVTTVVSTSLGCTGAGEALASAPSGDCNDLKASAHPGASDATADGIDSDCDGIELCFVDVDQDGYVSSRSTLVESATGDCRGPGEAPAEAASGDCDDTDAAYNPGAVEDDCTDRRDYNCDGSVAYADDDQDDYAACEECDDNNAAVNPESVESCNGIDDNCDGRTDGADAVGASIWYVDSDGDGYTGTVSVVQCDPPDGYAAASAEFDCDDLDASTNPGATDVAGDGIDQDCTGTDETPTDTGEVVDPGKVEDPKFRGCACATTGGGLPAAWVGVALLVAAGVRRRR